VFKGLTSAPDEGESSSSRCDRCYPRERRPTTIALVAGCTRSVGHKTVGAGGNLMPLQDLEPRFSDRLTDTANNVIVSYLSCFLSTL
jgi:hypothetical protein